MPPLEDIDGLTPAKLKDLVLKLLEKVAALERTVAAQRDEIARLKGGPGRPNIKPNSKPSGMEQATRSEAGWGFRPGAAPAWEHALEVVDRRGTQGQADRAAARLALQGLHQLRGAGPGVGFARHRFPVRALAGPRRQGDDGTAASRHRWSFRAATAALRTRPISSGSNHGVATGDIVAGPRHRHFQARGGPPADRRPGWLSRRSARCTARRAGERGLDHGGRHRRAPQGQ